MFQVDKQAVRQRLTTEQQRLMEELDDLLKGGETQGRASALARSNGLGDRADQAEDQSAGELQQAIIQPIREQLNQIRGALQRLDEGTYGLCARCGQPIDPRRLAAMPAALYDVTCQALQEQGA